MKTLSATDLAGFISRLSVAIDGCEQPLNAADARLGDGDTGSMLRRVIKAMEAADVSNAPDVAAAAMGLAQAAMKETGSSLGTLVATGAMAFARQAKALGNTVSASDMPAIVAAMRDAVAARGKAEPGDKTVIDSLDAIATAKAPLTVQAAGEAAEAALADFRDRSCRIGRARMFPEKSKGSDDPGMLAIALLLKSLR
ncbi:MAG: dihydroxyacetone kinase subunit L [Rhizobiaceae bacterium]|nr:dihydroxyacetone kinase subunit L [Rhizobiaceae bacterium]